MRQREEELAAYLRKSLSVHVPPLLCDTASQVPVADGPKAETVGTGQKWPEERPKKRSCSCLPQNFKLKNHWASKLFCQCWLILAGVSCLGFELLSADFVFREEMQQRQAAEASEQAAAAEQVAQFVMMFLQFQFGKPKLYSLWHARNALQPHNLCVSEKAFDPPFL